MLSAKTSIGLRATGILLGWAAFSAAALAQETPAADAKAPTTLDRAVSRGLDYLQKNGQAEDGTFTAKAGSGITALATLAALRNGKTVDDPMVAKGLQAIEGFVQPDGGIYGGGRLKNYETCISIVCLTAANQDGRYNTILKNAEQFVRGLQYGHDGDKEKSDPWFGGVGYGGPERPDLSNTSYLIDALVASKTSADDEAIQRALAFVSRCQNLKTKYNDTRFAALVNDGGFYYAIPVTKVDPSTSERYEANGGLRSYGSMTYAGFKSMVYAGLTQNDPRVKAAIEWIAKNYSVTENPGMGSAGLYYYYHTFAAALNAAKLDRVVDAQQKAHDWRQELAAELIRRQRPDGSWSNSNDRWFENDPNLATAFALLALSNCTK